MSCLGPKRGERDTIKVRRRVDVGQDDGYEKQPRKEYSRWRNGRYDSDEDRSRSNSRDAQGCHAFEKNVRNACFPSRFRAPTSVPKYDGETNPNIWLEDYRLACNAGGARDDLFIIKNLPLHITDSARALVARKDRQLVAATRHLRRQLPGHVRLAREPLGSTQQQADKGREFT
jgi:hypothetical protein